MSHVASVECIVKDVDALEAGCATIPRVKFKRGQQTYRYYGMWADDSPVPEGLFTAEELARVRAMDRLGRQKVMNARLGHCEHAIEVEGSGYDIGVVPRDDGKGYVMLYDWYGQGSALKVVAPLIAQGYMTEKTKAEARALGYAVETLETLEDGTRRLVLAR